MTTISNGTANKAKNKDWFHHVAIEAEIADGIADLATKVEMDECHEKGLLKPSLTQD